MAWNRLLYFCSLCLFTVFILNSRKYYYLNSHYEENQRFMDDDSAESGSVQRYLEQIYCDGCLLCLKSALAGFNIRTTSSGQEISAKNINMHSNNATALYETNLCPDLPPGLGPLTGSETRMLITEFETKYSELQYGGIFQPHHCKARHKVAVIIAYRGGRRYIAMFLFVLHQVLIKQQLDYQVFVVEQMNRTQRFNRGKLMNIGFKEAQTSRKNGFTCMIFHEANIVPTDSRNLYRCSWYPKQLASHVERTNKPPYVPKLGGAIAMTPEQYTAINGFSNSYWGNDGDLQDLFHRITIANYFVDASIPILGRYKFLRKNIGTELNKSENIANVSPLHLLDGLSTLSYKVSSFELRRMYTNIKVNIDEFNDTDYYDPLNHMYDKISNFTL